MSWCIHIMYFLLAVRHAVKRACKRDTAKSCKTACVWYTTNYTISAFGIIKRLWLKVIAPLRIVCEYIAEQGKESPPPPRAIVPAAAIARTCVSHRARAGRRGKVRVPSVCVVCYCTHAVSRFHRTAGIKVKICATLVLPYFVLISREANDMQYTHNAKLKAQLFFNVIRNKVQWRFIIYWT